MSVFKPYMALKKVENINLNLLRKLKIKLILADIDNTLVEHGLSNVSMDVEEWINKIKRQGIELVLVSNNNKNRVEKFARKVDLDYIAKAQKPLPFKINNMLRHYNKNEILFIGDQIFTDIIFANLLGIKSILLEPINKNEPKSIRFKRMLEKPLRKAK